MGGSIGQLFSSRISLPIGRLVEGQADRDSGRLMMGMTGWLWSGRLIEGAAG